MKPQNADENLAEQQCFDLYSKGKKVQLELWPWAENNIVRGPKNQIKIKCPSLPIGIVVYNNISEDYYDWLVDRYHNKFKPQDND